MKSMRPRETRTSVRISVRLASDDGWGDAEVRNVSSRGLMAVSSLPPPRGAYVELRRDNYSIVGRVVWSSGTSFGVQAQQNVSLPDLVRPRARPVTAGKERRAEARAPVRHAGRRKSPQDIADESARRARAFVFAVLAATALAFSFLLADQAAGMLGAPLDEVERTLRRANASSR
jgi:hypothetical protein